MGAESSKPKFSLGKKSSTRKETKHVEVLDKEAADWSIVTNALLCDWKNGTAEYLGFDLFDDWHAHNLIVHKKPWTPFVITGKVPNGKGGKQCTLCTFTCDVFETGREEKVSWWIKDMSVLALNAKVMVVQVVIAKAVKILVVDWQQNRLLGTYTFGYLDEPCLQQAFLSPDSTVLLLRQDFPLRRSLGHLVTFDANIRVIRIVKGLCRRLYVIRDSLAFNCFGSGISFDPRLPHDRVILISSSTQVGPAGVRSYDITKRQPTLTAGTCTDKVIHHAQHSPDGHLVGVLCVNMSMALCSTVFMDSIQLLCGDTLEVLHVISCSYCGPCKPLHSCVFPMFSRNARFLAQMSIGNSSVVHVHKLPRRSFSLQSCCRACILHHVPRRFIEFLPLPQRLLLYLKFTDTSSSTPWGERGGFLDEKETFVLEQSDDEEDVI